MTSTDIGKEKSEEEKEVSPEVAEEIRTVPSKPEVVKSMERLYSVPSEKLRVWSIWLTKIGDLADEWQRWLRAYIDLVLRIAEQLQLEEETLAKEEDLDEKVSLDTNGEEYLAKASEITIERTDTEGTIYYDFPNDKPTELMDSTIYKDLPAIAEERKSEDKSLEESESDDIPADTTVRVGEVVKIWPIGTPWIHLGIEDVVYKEPFERLPLPKTVEDMEELLKKFTYEATIYRSYYKHWKETADQAIKEVGCRSVMATFQAQGKDEHGCVKKPPIRKSVLAKLSRVPVARRKKSRRKAATKSKGALASETINEEEALATSTPVEGSPTNVTPESSKAELEMSSKSTASTKMSTNEAIEVDDLVKECARAAEPLPYIFYVKADPDIDIALEHDDKVVILADTDRENIFSNYRRLVFNLADKPSKGGKPWI